ncbi:MAG TPA: DUF192 domain-containing protein [Polyangiaceae bacterium]|nr:DUF192 domain-containing protein [Polyangiaceae bacterium]
MRPPVLLFCLLAGATCQRVDEPTTAPTPVEPASTSALPATPATTPATAATATSLTPTPVPPVDAGRCIEPLAEPPPPVAKPATTCPADDLATPPTLRHGKITAPEAKSAPALDVEIADTPATEQRGLMYRTKLGENKGMIFVWPSESRRTFWMHNTCIPLDMLFLAKDGTVVGLLEQVPTLNDRARSVRCAAAYVLEVNAGWTRRYGIKPGMKLELAL